MSHGESRGVKVSQGDPRGVLGGLGELRGFHGEPLETNRAKCLCVCESVSLSVSEFMVH